MKVNIIWVGSRRMPFLDKKLVKCVPVITDYSSILDKIPPAKLIGIVKEWKNPVIIVGEIDKYLMRVLYILLRTNLKNVMITTIIDNHILPIGGNGKLERYLFD